MVLPGKCYLQGISRGNYAYWLSFVPYNNKLFILLEAFYHVFEFGPHFDRYRFSTMSFTLT